MQTLGLLFLTCVACSPVEIINYNDEENGHGQIMEGTPGMEVRDPFTGRPPREMTSSLSTQLERKATWPLVIIFQCLQMFLRLP